MITHGSCLVHGNRSLVFVDSFAGLAEVLVLKFDLLECFIMASRAKSRPVEVSDGEEVEAPVTPPATNQDVAKEPPALPAGTSPKKRKKDTVVASVNLKPQWVDSLVKLYELPAKTCVAFEAMVLDFQPAKPFENRRVQALNITDGQVVVVLSIWSPACEKFEKMIKEHCSDDLSEKFPRFAISGVDIVWLESPVGAPVVKLQSSTKMEMKFKEAVDCCIVPSNNIVVTDFGKLTSVDVAANLMGILAECQETQTSRAQNPIKRAKLVDGSGMALPLMFHGHHALNVDLKDGVLISIWYGKAEPGLKLSEEEQSGRYFVYSDSYILVHAQHEVPEVKGVCFLR